MAMMPTYDELIQGNKNQRFLSTNPLFTRRRSMGAYGGGYGGDGAGLGTMGAIPDAATANVNGAYQRAGVAPGGAAFAGYTGGLSEGYSGPSSAYALNNPAEYARDNGGVKPTAPGMAYDPATQQMDAQDPTTGMGGQEIGRMMLESGLDPRVQAAQATVAGKQQVAETQQKTATDVANIKSLSSKEIAGLKGQGVNNVDDAVEAVKEGRMALSQLPGFGANSLKAQVTGALFKKYPDFDAESAEQSYKWKTNPMVMNTISQVNAVRPLIEGLRDDYAKLDQSDVQAANKVGNWTKEQLGKPEIAAFEYRKQAVIKEVERALTGSGQMSDSRVKMEVDALKSTYSPEQMNAALDEMEAVLSARKGAYMGGPQAGSPASGGNNQPMDKLPDAKAHQGKKIRETVTGKIFMSNGSSWVPTQ